VSGPLEDEQLFISGILTFPCRTSSFSSSELWSSNFDTVFARRTAYEQRQKTIASTATRIATTTGENEAELARLLVAVTAGVVAGVAAGASPAGVVALAVGSGVGLRVLSTVTTLEVSTVADTPLLAKSV